MSEGLQHIDDYFKSSLKNYEAHPPMDVWNLIEEDLNVSDKKQKFLFLYRVAAAITFIAIIGTAYLYYQNIDKTEITENENNNTKNIINKNNNLNKEQKLSTNKNNIIANPNTAEIAVINKRKEQNNNIQDIIIDKQQTDNDEENIFIFTSREIDDIEQIKPLTSKIDNSYQSNIQISDHFIAAQLQKMFSPYESEYTDDKNKTEWSVGGQFSPMIARRDVREKEANLALYSNTLDENELLAYSGGINIEIETDKRLSVQSGIYYSRMGQQINNIAIYSSEQYQSATVNYQNSGIINTSSGQLQTEPGTNYYVDKSLHEEDYRNEPTTIEPIDANFEYITNLDEEPMMPEGQNDIINERVSSAVKNYVESDESIGYDAINESINPVQLNQENKLNKTFEYIEVPIILKYKIIESKMDIHVLGGMSTNFLVNNKLYYYTIDGKRNTIPEATNFSSINYSSIVGIGFEYPVATNLVINFEPSFKYFLNSINTDDYISSHPYSFAFFSGLSYKF